MGDFDFGQIKTFLSALGGLKKMYLYSLLLTEYYAFRRVSSGLLGLTPLRKIYCLLSYTRYLVSISKRVLKPIVGDFDFGKTKRYLSVLEALRKKYTSLRPVCSRPDYLAPFLQIYCLMFRINKAVFYGHCISGLSDLDLGIPGPQVR